ncbi:MAG: excinuclease ABC subunit UvrA [Saccharofermentanales bacterium]
MNHEFIVIKGAREHNLKNIDLMIPRDRLVVLTGLSGSGKSSLAFDTIYAEGQRRYVESLSSYARQFLGQMEKPDVDSIEGLSPAISIDQKTTSKNPRSTVGTVTEIYDYLRLLYARVGTPHCPECGKLIEQQTVDQIVDALVKYPAGTRLLILAPVIKGRKGEYSKLFDDLRKSGYSRVRIDGEYLELDEEITLEKNRKHSIEAVIDRIILKPDIAGRITDSVETATTLSEGTVIAVVQVPDETAPGTDLTAVRPDSIPEPAYVESEHFFSQNFACSDCEISFEELAPRMFSFNNPFGACPHCLGLGNMMDIDPELIISDHTLSLNEGAIKAGGWNFGDPDSWARAFIEALSARYHFSLDTPYNKLPKKIQKIIMYGNGGEILSIDTTNSKYSHGTEYRADFKGIVPIMEKRYQETSSDDMKEYYEQFMSKTPCPVCHGARLKKESLAVLVGSKNIYDLTCMPIEKSRHFLEKLRLSERKTKIAERILKEIDARLGFLVDVGLEYMTLARGSATLSGGEAQRIRLATQIGSGLMGVLYILDEPSIGLHQKDNMRLLKTLKKLRDLGNTVLVVEHDEETMMESDYIVDMGPLAGEQGGFVVAAGTVQDIMACPESITGQYLSGIKEISIPSKRRAGTGQFLTVVGARENNLKNISVSIPLGVMTCITGVSGSGKSSLVNGIILKKLMTELNGARRSGGLCDRIDGIEHLDKVIDIDQSPIGRTPRSNPATYTGVFDFIRNLFSGTPDARARGYKQGRFSFNVKGGRCEACSGDGVNKIEMHFLPDIYVTCDVCKGRRYNRETLEVRYKGKNIADVLEMTVSESVQFFSAIPRIYRKLITLDEVGLGYIRLGQPSTQLSGGEAQRVKLATELSRRGTGNTLYILDEPTTGLHIADVHKLVDILDRLTDSGNTVVVIEHNLEMIKTADYIIDLGPDGGDGGGEIVTAGTPEDVAMCDNSYTGQYLHKILKLK